MVSEVRRDDWKNIKRSLSYTDDTVGNAYMDSDDMGTAYTADLEAILLEEIAWIAPALSRSSLT
jgi:hypothetical protein